MKYKHKNQNVFWCAVCPCIAFSNRQTKKCPDCGAGMEITGTQELVIHDGNDKGQTAAA